MLFQALGGSLPVKTRKSKGERVSNPAPRALKLDGQPILERLAPSADFFRSIALENGFFNFYFSSRWYALVIEDTPCPAIRREIPLGKEISSPCPLTLWDLRFLTALCGAAPDWTLAARQDQGNPAWLVRYTAARLAALEGRPGPAGFSREIRDLICLAADYPCVSGAESRTLARYLCALSHAVWEITPQKLPEAARRCVGEVLRAGMHAFS